MPALVVAGTLALAVIVAVVLTGDQDDGGLGAGRSGPIDERAGLALAREACQGVDVFVGLVEANADARRVLEQLDEIVGLSSDAVGRDPTWLPLASGAQSLRRGVEDDSARATRVGMDVVLAQCERTR